MLLTMLLWRDIPGYEGLYQVSALGRVRSLDHVTFKKSTRGTTFDFRTKGRLLRQYHHQTTYHKSGYWYVTLCKNGVRKNFFVHQLVLLTFVGPCPVGMLCCHENDNGKDNRLSNVRWDTQKNNHKDSVRNGTAARLPVIARKDFGRLKQMFAEGYNGAEVAIALGITRQGANAIRRLIEKGQV